MSFFARITKTISTSAPITFLVNKSKVIVLPGFQGIPLFDVINFFARQVKKVGMKERASAIAFNFVMAIPPAIIFFFTLIPYLPIAKPFVASLNRLIIDIIPGQQKDSALLKFLEDFIKKPRTGLLSIGFILSLYFSSNAVLGIMRSFDKNYEGFRKRKTIEKRGVALKLTMILFVLVFISVLFLAAPQIFNLIGHKERNHPFRMIINNIRWVVIVLLFFYSISYIYLHAPAVHKKWKFVNTGSIVATFLMILFTLGFSYWVNHFGKYNQLYGSISTILIMMLLIYFNSLVLLIGFELNVSITSLKRIADERNKNPADGNKNPG